MLQVKCPYPKNKCYFCNSKLEANHKEDLKCSKKECYNEHAYKVIRSIHNMIEFRLGNYFFEYYFGDEPDDRGMRILSTGEGEYSNYKNKVIIDITENRHMFVTKDNYLQIIQKCKTLNLFS